MNDFKVELMDINLIVPYDKNAKVHDKNQIKILVNSIKKFGWTQPIVVDKDNVIIIGHGRRLAAIEMGLSKIPVVVRKDLSKKEADKLRLSDNKSISNEYDMSIIKEEINRISDSDLSEWEELGFTEHELSFMNDDIIAEMDDSAFEEDIIDAVENRKKKNEVFENEIGDTEVPLAKATGFSKIKLSSSKIISDFFIRIVEKYPRETIEESFLAYIEDQNPNE